jgi:FkbM family methyltransferase
MIENIGDLIAEHSTFLSALECSETVETAIERGYGWRLDVVDPQMAVSQIDQIVIRRLNDFVTQNEHPVILDCGANIGISVLNYKRKFPGARITAFEPDPSICRVLRGNLERNGAADVEVIEAAVWTGAGEAAFMSTGTDGGRVDLHPPSQPMGALVATVDLREYLNKPIDLLKLDIEGAEYDVVHHVCGTLSNVANLVLECHIDQTTLAQFSKLLHELQSEGFHLSLNTFGTWSDLVRRSHVFPPYSEQYLALYAWRPDAALPATASSYLPYLNLSMFIELNRVHNRRGAPKYYETEGRMRRPTLELEGKIELFGPFVSDGGYGWAVMLPAKVPEGDTVEHPTASNIVLLEDGQPIGPPHTQHEWIRQYGGGRFSHWHRGLYFSTPDDSDPNLNNRRYVVGVPKAAAAKPKRK